MFRTFQVSELPNITQTSPETMITRRHIDYIRVCEYVAIAVRCNIYTLPSCRKIATSLNIGKSCVNKHIQELITLGWLRRCVDGNSWRNITYNITLTKEEASNFIEYVASLPSRDKKKKMSRDISQLDNVEFIAEQGRLKKCLGGYVYIIKFKDYYKIGRTINLKNRMNEYTRLPVEPKIIISEYVSDCINVEIELHNMYEHKRLRGEWFALDNVDLENIKKYFMEDWLKWAHFSQ